MVEGHLEEIVSSWVDEVVDQSADVVAHGDQGVLFELVGMLRIRILSERLGEISFAAQPFWHIILVNEHVVSPVSGSDEIEEFVGAEGSLTTSPCPLRDIVLLLANGNKHDIEDLSANVFKDGEAYRGDRHQFHI